MVDPITYLNHTRRFMQNQGPPKPTVEEFPKTIEKCHAEIAALRAQQKYLFNEIEQLKLRLSF